MKLEIRNISVSSLVLSSVPVVAFLLGIFGGLVKFFFIPDPQYIHMPFIEKVLSIGLYSLVYMFLVAAFIVIVAFVYNIMTGVLGLRGVTFDIEEVHE